MKKILFILLLSSLLGLSSCSDYVNGIDSPINNISDEALNNPTDVKVLTIGLYNDWCTTWDSHTLLVEGLSDAMEFHRDLKGATYPSFESIDLANVVGDYPLDDRNSSLAGLFRQLGRLRLLSDTLVHRVIHNVTFETEKELQIRKEALFYGHFFGGLSRYMYAYFWALTPSLPGGVINKSALIPANRMYEYAIEYLIKSKEFATPYQKNVANSLIARIYLIQGNYKRALDFAEAGLVEGDPDFEANYNSVNENMWNKEASSLRVQFCVADRYGDYIYENPGEARRIPIKYVETDKKVKFDKDTVIAGIMYYKGQEQNRKYAIQDKYNLPNAPIVFTSWRENYLIFAEISYKMDGDIEGALTYINKIREQFYLPRVKKDYVEKKYASFEDFLAEERDKTLCFTGLRIMDQRRFNIWHRDPNNSWMYFPITIQEKINNPNLKPTVTTRDPNRP